MNEMAAIYEYDNSGVHDFKPSDASPCTPRATGILNTTIHAQFPGMNDECSDDAYMRVLPCAGLVRRPTAFVIYTVSSRAILMTCAFVNHGHTEMVQRLYSAHENGEHLTADLARICDSVDATHIIVPGRRERGRYGDAHLCKMLSARTLRRLHRHISVIHLDMFSQAISAVSPRIPGHDARIWLERITSNHADYAGCWGERGLMRTAAWADIAMFVRFAIQPVTA